jgi:hypothetical protein
MWQFRNVLARGRLTRLAELRRNPRPFIVFAAMVLDFCLIAAIFAIIQMRDASLGWIDVGIMATAVVAGLFLAGFWVWRIVLMADFVMRWGDRVLDRLMGNSD